MIDKGSRVKDRYRLEQLLGRGGMASVWLASDEVLERPVAVKILADTIASDPGFLARFRREAHVAAGLSHPNLVEIYDYAEGAERPYLVMEHVPGEDLAERMSQGADIDCERIARDLLGALAHIHAAGILHRDIKPQNVLISPEGDVKLIDFGIALPRDATSLTQTDQLIGTARYIAPEVMEGSPASERSDLFSCGVVLRDCRGDDDAGYLHALVEHLTSADPRDRTASATEALALIDRGAPAVDQPTQPIGTTEPGLRPEADTRRHEQTARLPGGSGRERAPGARPRAPARALAAAALVAAAIAGIVLIPGEDARQGEAGSAGQNMTAGGGGDGQAADESSQATGGGEGDQAAGTSEGSQAAGEGDQAEGDNPVPAPEGNDPARGGSLNQQGFELIEAGRHEEAIPVLEAAIRAFPSGTDDLNYAYALYNLGNALRLSGQPEEAIPVLEHRLQIPNQTDAVRQELAAARREARS